jgi:hypothetical protein
MSSERRGVVGSRGVATEGHDAFAESGVGGEDAAVAVGNDLRRGAFLGQLSGHAHVSRSERVSLGQVCHCAHHWGRSLQSHEHQGRATPSRPRRTVGHPDGIASRTWP